MNEEKIEIPIRTALIPNYYQKFHCLAQACQDNCCTENWLICFDKKDYLRLRRLDADAEMKEKLEKYVRRNKKGNHDGVLYAKFDLASNGGHCPFLDEEGLCSIQRAHGHEALPLVCTSYPRKVRYTAAAKEYMVSPSCEGVLQQLWELPDGIEFVEEPLPKKECRVMRITPGETLVAFFEPIRALCIDILQNRSMPLPQRMLYLGMVLQRLQNEDWENFNAGEWVERQQALLGSVPIGTELPGNTDMFLVQNLEVLSKIGLQHTWVSEIYNTLEVQLEVNFEDTLASLEENTAHQAHQNVKCSKSAYMDALSQFQTAFVDREYFFENLMVASALFLVFPGLESKENLWKGYVSLCSLYSLFRFVSVLGCKQEATKERLFHFIAMASRATLHSKDRFDEFQDELFQQDSATLAHMAILLDG